MSAEDKKDSMVEVKLRAIVVEQDTQAPVILLGEEGKNEVVPIWIGIAEARSIALGVQGAKLPRPLTHDLLNNVIKELGAFIEKIVINDLRDDVYFAEIYLNYSNGKKVIDSRPSDAVALAVRTGAPIYISNTVMDKASTLDIRNLSSRGEGGSSPQSPLNPDDFSKYTM